MGHSLCFIQIIHYLCNKIIYIGYSMSTTMSTKIQLLLFVMLCMIAGCAGNQDKAEGLNSKVYLRFE